MDRRKRRRIAAAMPRPCIDTPNAISYDPRHALEATAAADISRHCAARLRVLWCARQRVGAPSQSCGRWRTRRLRVLLVVAVLVAGVLPVVAGRRRMRRAAAP